jgi:hypothetical protein
MSLKDEASSLRERYDRERFIAFRTRLIERGIHDPVLMRFDSHTVSRVDDSVVVERLGILDESLPG